MLYFCQTLEEYKSLKSKLSFSELGFVPTMGNLHEGHLSLLKSSIEENDASLLSIFVNPTQFAKNEDFDEYPRTLEEDLLKIEKAMNKFGKEDATVIVFAPKDEEEIYPKGFEKVGAGKTGKILEGELRPEHFDGVVTVVKRFITMFKPTRAYFGKKDFQQFTLIKQMVKKENLKVKVVGLPTVRESSGLALSSRNGYLEENEKDKGLKLRATLLNAQKLLKKEKDLESLKKFLAEELAKDPNFNYLVVRNAENLEEAKDLSSPIVILGNYQVGKVRLLDNIEVELT